jgi:hypothetical protein
VETGTVGYKDTIFFLKSTIFCKNPENKNPYSIVTHKNTPASRGAKHWQGFVKQSLFT